MSEENSLNSLIPKCSTNELVIVIYTRFLLHFLKTYLGRDKYCKAVLYAPFNILDIYCG